MTLLSSSRSVSFITMFVVTCMDIVGFIILQLKLLRACSIVAAHNACFNCFLPAQYCRQYLLKSTSRATLTVTSQQVLMTSRRLFVYTRCVVVFWLCFFVLVVLGMLANFNAIATHTTIVVLSSDDSIYLAVPKC